MNSMRRAFGLFAAASTDSTALFLRSYSSATWRGSKSTSAAPPSDAAVSEIPRPSEIPFQPKVANAVNLIGQVRMPVQFQTSPDGKTWAATVITREESHSSPYLRIPVIFEGDLAHTAACHVKENDFIYVAGQLSTDPPHLDEDRPQNDIQIMVQSLNFVEGYPQVKNVPVTSKQGKVSSLSAAAKNDPLFLLNSWRELLDDPKQWVDFRDSKLNGLVNPRYPDFKHKDGSVALWLNQAPQWILSKLKDLEFEVPVFKSKPAKGSKGDQSWNDLLKNPDKWWDNRSNKRNERAPDFKHKETGEGLWLNGSPSWVLSKLPPLNLKQSVEIGSKQTLAS